MTDAIQITVVGNRYIGEYEPGNGTRYTAIAYPWTADSYLMLGALGTVTDGWLVISGNSGRAALFQKYGTLVDDYIQEKLGGGDGDYPYFGDLIRALVKRSNPEPTYRIVVAQEPAHSDLDTIDLEHDLGLRDLTDPWER